MSDNENALRLGFPKPRALPPCLTGAHGEACDNLCAEVAKNTGMEVAECGCPCHGREVASDPLAQALAEVQRLTAELALKDQALDEIKHALEIGTWPGYGLTVERIERVKAVLRSLSDNKEQRQ